MTGTALKASGDTVYPCSVASGIQTGDIITLGGVTLFWHFCGFAHLSGTPGADILDALAARYFGETPPPRRFVLISDDDAVCGYFAGRPDFILEQRIYYRYPAEQRPPEFPLPEGFSLRRIDAALLPCLNGRIVPSWSWETPAQFLANGFGYCVMCGDTPAAWAFTAAVTPSASDIGLETAEPFRRKGLAKAAAAAVLREILTQGKTAVWAHHAANTGSMKTALALGFSQTHLCYAIRKA